MKTPKFLNSVILLVLAASIGLWSFAVYGPEKVEQVGDWTLSGDAVFEENVAVKKASVYQMNGRDAVVLFPGATATVTWDAALDELFVDLESGAAMFSTLAGDFDLTLRSQQLQLDSRNNQAYVNADEAQWQVYALEHPAELSFWMEDQYLNALSIPAEHRVLVPESKLTETVGRLRLTKLTKEFPAFPLGDDDISKDLQSHMDFLDDSYASASLNFLADLQEASDFGPSQEGLTTVVQNVETNLTLLPHAQARLQEELQADALTYSMTHFLYGEASEGQRWLQEWTRLSRDAELLDDLEADLFFVLPGHELYEVKDAIAKELYVGESTLSALQRQYQEIEQLLNAGDLVQAQQAYTAYASQFQAAIDAGLFNDVLMLPALSRETILLELLLRQNAIFYALEDVALLSQLEAKILSLAASAQDLDEERLAFIQSKLRFLDKLFDFVREDLVTPDAAEVLAGHLVDEAEAYLNNLTTQVAVRDYFESELELYALSVEFMNSPEFYSYDSFEEGLAAYSQKVEDLDELNAYLQEIRLRTEEDEVLGFTQEAMQDAIREVGQDFTLNQLQYAAIEPLGDADLRLFEVLGGRASGFAFDAKYDRDTELLYDIVVEDSVRFSTGIDLRVAHDVIVEAMAEPEAEEDATQGPAQEGLSLKDGVALELAEAEMIAAGFQDDDLSLILDDADFVFSGTLEESRIEVSGSYDSISGRVSAVTWMYKDTEQSLPSIDLKSLEAAISATRDALDAAQSAAE
jgi:hypothetical protein